MSDDDNWLGHFLLGLDGRQQRDIERLKTQASLGNQLREADAGNIRALRNRVDRLELVCEALLHLALQHGLVDREGLALLMAQIDLRDGREDGRISGEEPAPGARTCTTCDLPINPRRDACIYCGAAIEKRPRRGAASTQPVRTVMCARCHKQVDAQRTVITGDGVCCDACNIDD